VRKDIRRELITVTVLSSPLGVTQVLHLDYWQPEYFFPITESLGIEDFLWAGIVLGIAATMYELVARRRTYRRSDVRTSYLADVWLSIAVVVGVLLLQFATLGLGASSALVATIGLLAFALNIVVYRRDLIADSVLSGMLLMGLSFVIYLIWQVFYTGIFRSFWLDTAFELGTVAEIPVIELAYLFAIGAALGPVYEVVGGLRLRHIARR
jgi:hypothetical protein